MAADLLTSLAEHGGTVGITLGLAYLYIRQQHKEIREVESARVEDNKAMVSKLLELNDKWSETLNSQAELMESQRRTLESLQALMIEHDRHRPKR